MDESSTSFFIQKQFKNFFAEKDPIRDIVKWDLLSKKMKGSHGTGIKANKSGQGVIMDIFCIPWSQFGQWKVFLNRVVLKKYFLHEKGLCYNQKILWEKCLNFLQGLLVL